MLNEQLKQLLTEAIFGNANSYAKYKILTAQPSILAVAGKRSELDLQMFSFVFEKLKKLTINQLDNCHAILLLELAHINFHPNINDQIKNEFKDFLTYFGQHGSFACLKMRVFLIQPSDDEIDQVMKKLHKVTLRMLCERIPDYSLEWEAHEDDMDFYHELVERRIKLDPAITIEELVHRPFLQRTERQLTTDIHTLEYQEHAIQQVKEMKAILLSYKKHLSAEECEKMLAYFSAAAQKNIVKSQRNDYMADRYLGDFMFQLNQPDANDDKRSILRKKNNLESAFLHFRRAVYAGDPYASFFLGKYQLQGFLSIKQPKIGLSLIRDAACWGLLPAQRELGHFYYKEGRDQEASIWYQLAIDQGALDLTEKLAICQHRMQASVKENAAQANEASGANVRKEIDEIFPADFDWAGMAQDTDEAADEIFPNDFGFSTIAEENDEPPMKKQKTDEFYSSHSSLFKPSMPLSVARLDDEQFIDKNTLFIRNDI